MALTPPVLNETNRDATAFFTQAGRVTRGHLAFAAQTLAQALPQTDIANACHVRSHFALTLLAAGLAGRHCHLTGATQSSPAGAFVIDDAFAGRFLEQAANTSGTAVLPLDISKPRYTVYTSGSTGRPTAHVKSWASLWQPGSALFNRLIGDLENACMVATVPPQHMYGLETTTAMVLAGGCSADDASASFPQDIRAAAARHAATVLVTTPLHLQVLLQAEVKIHNLVRIISATAPLPDALARKAEQIFKAPVLEIYGCTEAGSMATRRTVEGSLWLPLPCLRLQQCTDGTVAQADYLPEKIKLTDRIEFVANDASACFRLLGRDTDMVKVAGKRASLARLNENLRSIPGVVDGVIFQPDNADETQVLQRLAAIVVAPSLTESRIRQALSQMIDPVLMPRPLRLVDKLPRTELGKIPRTALNRLAHHA